MLNDPQQARDFVAQTGVDALAMALGTSHGAYKFTRPPTGDILAMDRLNAIHRAIPNTHLAMTGAMRRTMVKNPGEFDPRKFFKDATVAAKEICQARFQSFGCAGMAGKIVPMPLEKMIARYV